MGVSAKSGTFLIVLAWECYVLLIYLKGVAEIKPVEIHLR